MQMRLCISRGFLGRAQFVLSRHGKTRCCNLRPARFNFTNIARFLLVRPEYANKHVWSVSSLCSTPLSIHCARNFRANVAVIKTLPTWFVRTIESSFCLQRSKLRNRLERRYRQFWVQMILALKCTNGYFVISSEKYSNTCENLLRIYRIITYN